MEAKALATAIFESIGAAYLRHVLEWMRPHSHAHIPTHIHTHTPTKARSV